MGLVIEKTESFPCMIVKKTFQVTCGVASFSDPENEVDKRVSQIVLKMSGKFVQSGFGK